MLKKKFRPAISAGRMLVVFTWLLVVFLICVLGIAFLHCKYSQFRSKRLILQR